MSLKENSSNDSVLIITLSFKIINRKNCSYHSGEDVQYEGFAGPQAQDQGKQQENVAENDNEGLHGHLEAGAEAEQQLEHEEDQYDGFDNRAHAQQIPILVPGAGERRPYHELARVNAEALNRLLPQEVPILTRKLQNTMELMDQLMRRQLNN